MSVRRRWMISSDLLKYLMTRSIARSICDSWAACSSSTTSTGRLRASDIFFHGPQSVYREEQTLRLQNSQRYDDKISSTLENLSVCINFTKLFKTSNIRIVQLCQKLFHFDLPSVQLSRRRKVFLDKFCVQMKFVVVFLVCWRFSSVVTPWSRST